MALRLTGDEVQSTEGGLPIMSVEEFLRNLGARIPAFDETIVNVIRQAEQKIRGFAGTQAELEDCAWKMLTPELSKKFEHASSLHLLVTLMCDRVVRQSCLDDGDAALISQRSGYMAIRMEGSELALNEMAAGFTRKISVDEVIIESPQKYRAFLDELVDMGKRNLCSLNEQKFCIADVESERVLHMALSYRHVNKGGTIDEHTANLVAESIHTYLTMTNRTELRLWVDQVSSRNRSNRERDWGAIGLLPYSTLRVMFISNRLAPNRNVDYLKRPWLFYELYAGMMASGVFTLKRTATQELSQILHIEKSRGEHRDVFDRNGVLAGFGLTPFLALDAALARCLTDHELSIEGYLYGDDFMKHCNWAIRRGAWKQCCDIGWGLTDWHVDSVTLHMYVHSLCSPTRGVRFLGVLDPLVRGSKYGTRKRQGPLCLEDMFNDIPFLPREGTGTRIDELFTVSKWHERDSSERFRIARSATDNIFAAIRGNQIRLCESVLESDDTPIPPLTARKILSDVFKEREQTTSTSSDVAEFRSKYFSPWPPSYEDSDSDMSRESKCVMLECASRVASSRIQQVFQMLGGLSRIAEKDRQLITSMYTERFRRWVDPSVGNEVTIDTVRIARKFLTNDPRMCDDQLLEAINDIGKTVSFQNLRDKMHIVCWKRAKELAYSHVLEIACDGKQGIFIYVTEVKSNPVKTRRRVFTLTQQRLFLARSVFVLLKNDMEEDDIVALACIYGAVSARTIKTAGEWPLYSRVPYAGSGKPLVKLPEELVEGGIYVGYKKYYFHARRQRDHSIILAEGVNHVRSRVLQMEHPQVIRSELVVYCSNLQLE